MSKGKLHLKWNQEALKGACTTYHSLLYKFRQEAACFTYPGRGRKIFSVPSNSSANEKPLQLSHWEVPTTNSHSQDGLVLLTTSPNFFPSFLWDKLSLLCYPDLPVTRCMSQVAIHLLFLNKQIFVGKNNWLFLKLKQLIVSTPIISEGNKIQTLPQILSGFSILFEGFRRMQHSHRLLAPHALF